MKPVCQRVIVVEGKYDKIRLDSILDATVVTTDGFGLFRDEEKKTLLRRLAKERGLVVLCDSDGGGSVIRSHIRTITGGEGVTDLYIPPIHGKEKRKAAPGKAGLLGVEGMTGELLLSLFEKSGLLGGEPRQRRYTKADLYAMGYTGGPESKQKREAVLEKAGLPKTLSSNAFLEIVSLLEIPL